MFIFYYAVLSEVSPPTALSPFAAAAITGGKPVKTMLTWKYTLPAFLVPFAFTRRAGGLALLLRAPARRTARRGSAALGVGALAVAWGDGCAARSARSARWPRPPGCCSSIRPRPRTSAERRSSE